MYLPLPPPIVLLRFHFVDGNKVCLDGILVKSVESPLTGDDAYLHLQQRNTKNGRVWVCRQCTAQHGTGGEKIKAWYIRARLMQFVCCSNYAIPPTIVPTSCD